MKSNFLLKLLVLFAGILSFFGNLSAQRSFSCSIYFASNASMPSLEEDSKLKKFVSLPDSVYITAIELHGFSDDVGKSTYNDSLAMKRAESIRKTLISWNIDEKLISKALSKGEVTINKGDKDAEKKRAASRRVDVILQTAVKEKPKAEPEKIADGPPKDLLKIDSSQWKKPYTIPDLIPDSVEVGDNYRLEDIYFEGDRSTLLPSSNITLDRLLKLLTDKPKIHIVILGHVCCLPAGEDAPDKNTGKKNLSVGRAKAIYDYLIKKGIDAKRLSYKGMKANKKTGKGAAWDRRVEVEILKK